MHWFLKFILERNSTCFGQFLCPSSGVFHCTHSNGVRHTGVMTAKKLSAKTVWHIPLLCLQWKTPDDGQRNCPKHVEFRSKIKPTRCTNFSKLFLERNSTCFGQFLCPSLGVFHCTHSNGVRHTDLMTAKKLSAKTVWHIPLLCVQWKTPDDGQKNCPKHV
jgi:hypothetical protein